jgi:transcriptional regulator with XRE-family HTH domain
MIFVQKNEKDMKNAKNVSRLDTKVARLDIFFYILSSKCFFCEKSSIMTEITIKQKKEWAKLLYVNERLTQKETAERVGVSVVTLNKWVKEGEWDKLRQSMLVTREAQLSRMYLQLDALNTTISNREENQRFPSSKEADAMSKLANAIKTLESDASIADIVEVSKRLLNWLRPLDPGKARDLALIIDDFIKESLKR